jgi:hypothetical protein
MELYTSLTRLKMALNGGVLPPMTALTERARALLDPAFTPGMGALEEHAEKGLRCPVRGCGQYFHQLSTHISGAHRNTISVHELRDALGIPQADGLVSTKLRLRLSSANGRAGGAAHLRNSQHPMTRPGRKEAYSVARRNLRDRCDAQIADKIRGLALELGRSPTAKEVRTRFSPGLMQYIYTIYGSFNALKGYLGLTQWSAKRRSLAVDDLIASFGHYVAVHGDLPTAHEANNPTRTPLIPTYGTVKRALGVKTWAAAMEQLAAALDIRGGRYGLRRAV